MNPIADRNEGGARCPQRAFDRTASRQRIGEKPLHLGLKSGFILLLASSLLLAAENPLFTATPLTEINSFTKGVEGPACDAAGNVYAVNFGEQQAIGKVTPDGKAEVFVTLSG